MLFSVWLDLTYIFFLVKSVIIILRTNYERIQQAVTYIYLDFCYCSNINIESRSRWCVQKVPRTVRYLLGGSVSEIHYIKQCLLIESRICVWFVDGNAIRRRGATTTGYGGKEDIRNWMTTTLAFRCFVSHVFLFWSQPRKMWGKVAFHSLIVIINQHVGFGQDCSS